MKPAGRYLRAVALVVVAIALAGCSRQQVPVTAKSDGTVTIEGAISGPAAVLLEKSWAGWEKANHITIRYEGSGDFDEQVATDAQQGNAPDLGIFGQPGLVDDLAVRGYLKALPQSVETAVKGNFPAGWSSYGVLDGTAYAAPLLASVNGWVFYSPKQFAEWGVSVPKTWQDLEILSSRIRTLTGSAPWCDGFSADASTGVSGANWIEDLVLREDGAAVYDKWVDHSIPFSDPRILAAFSDADEILLNKDWVNAGLGGVSSIATSTESDVAAALESGKCALTHQSSSFVAALTNAKGAAADVSPSGDYWAFLLPPVTTNTAPVTGSGEFVAAFSNDPDTIKVQQYLAGDSWARVRVALGGVVSPDTGIGPSAEASPLLQESVRILQSPTSSFRLSASDVMPSIVGAGTFLTGMEDWVKGESTPQVAADIDKSWPTAG